MNKKQFKVGDKVRFVKRFPLKATINEIHRSGDFSKRDGLKLGNVYTVSVLGQNTDSVKVREGRIHYYLGVSHFVKARKQ